MTFSNTIHSASMLEVHQKRIAELQSEASQLISELKAKLKAELAVKEARKKLIEELESKVSKWISGLKDKLESAFCQKRIAELEAELVDIAPKRYNMTFSNTIRMHTHTRTHTMQNPLQTYFLNCSQLLMTTSALGYFQNRQVWKTQEKRVGTMSVESALFDMCACVMYDNDKREKRIKRIQHLFKLYTAWGYVFDDDLIALIEAALTQQVVESKPQNSDDMLTDLQKYLAANKESENAVIYFDAGIWIPPVCKTFHGMCTKIINQDGDVYDIMMKIAVIAFSHLLNDYIGYQHQQCATQLLSGAQLIFKGGAAIGKFLFQKHPIWNMLTNDQKDEIVSSFILGGDNDTSIYFANMTVVAKKYGNKLVSETVTEIAFHMERILFVVCEEFKVAEQLSQHSTTMIKSQISFADREFNISTRKTKGFRITDVNEYESDEVVVTKKTMCLSPFSERNASQVFTTQSTVEFMIGKGNLAKFELVRAKLGFLAKHGNMEVNTYSELLDISIGYPENTSIFPKKWTVIDMSI